MNLIAQKESRLSDLFTKRKAIIHNFLDISPPLAQKIKELKSEISENEFMMSENNAEYGRAIYDVHSEEEQIKNDYDTQLDKLIEEADSHGIKEVSQ